MNRHMVELTDGTIGEIDESDLHGHSINDMIGKLVEVTTYDSVYEIKRNGIVKEVLDSFDF